SIRPSAIRLSALARIPSRVPWPTRRAMARSSLTRCARFGGNARGTLEGSRRAFSADFIRTLADDFRLHGRQAIEKVRKTQPAAYMKICALLVPREMKLEHSGGVKAMTDEQLERTLEAIETLMRERNIKVIDGVAVSDASSALPQSAGQKHKR